VDYCYGVIGGHLMFIDIVICNQLMFIRIFSLLDSFRLWMGMETMHSAIDAANVGLPPSSEHQSLQ
jgi:hypothetical protein